MPVKTDEKVRLSVVELKRKGHSYSQIQKMTGLTPPTIAKVLKEAGMTHPRGTEGSRPQQKSSAGSEPIPISSDDGLSSFQPAAKVEPVKKKKASGRVYCDHCGTGFDFEDESEVPDKCPECGA